MVVGARGDDLGLECGRVLVVSRVSGMDWGFERSVTVS
jgi:hypothetical protein